VIRFSCPECTSVVEVADNEAGSTVICPTCGGRNTAPAGRRAVQPPPESPPVATAVPIAEEATSVARNSDRDEEGELVRVQDCPDCGRKMKVPEDEVGTRVSCPTCGEKFVARKPEDDEEEEEDDDDRSSRRKKSRKSIKNKVPADVSSKKLTAGLLGIFLGGFGVHKFVLGMNTAGTIMLLVSVLTCGFGYTVMYVIGLVEGILYLTKPDEEFYQTYMVEKKEWF
jgi:DNA-directed RNA polymerase subunit M/transcription elongation factor TFIIS